MVMKAIGKIVWCAKVEEVVNEYGLTWWFKMWIQGERDSGWVNERSLENLGAFSVRNGFGNWVKGFVTIVGDRLLRTRHEEMRVCYCLEVSLKV